MFGLVMRMTTVALIVFCAAMADHALPHPHHAHVAHAAVVAPPDPAGPGAGDAVPATGERPHDAHPCITAALLPPVSTGVVDLAEVVPDVPVRAGAVPVTVTADAAHPPGRSAAGVLSTTCVHRI
ncbi:MULTISPECIES: hypothetical protein [Catenuloplanes]|uniref:Secreted protein n=2 Tax=Catenuloplanes TaxID=33874 RepID=A0AAE3YPS7_9ACTN|nr:MULTISPECIES: hypothetical protein [Catenuloplanes]MDQ0366887.1 hypothetical protein [Catenuloplanes indicus]MDR7277609.1 hypothetical protein [Catenuloplanes atrovinosus]